MTYMLFGMVLLLPALKGFNPTIALYALLSLTVVRMLPVAISLIGTKLQPVTVLFLGWFGLRSIASILYVLAVLDEDLATKETIYNVVMITVFVSVLAHGISATPLANWYGNRMAEVDGAGSVGTEMKPVPEMATRTGIVHGATNPVSMATESE
ncbi:MAG: cation:proton antiporter [Anaerolineae bacterium]|nr:cation:proton antiporter [Anaerolineae bacterium]